MEYTEPLVDFGHPRETNPNALRNSNIMYMVVFTMFGILCFVLLNSGSNWLGKIINTSHTASDTIGASLVSRTSFALTVWFLVHALVTFHSTLDETHWQFHFHTERWWVHILILLIVWVGCWFLPDLFFDFWLKVTPYISFLYLVIQIFFLVDWFNIINDELVDRGYETILYVATVVMSIGTIIAFGLSYYFFGYGGCTMNQTVAAVNLGFSVAFVLAGFALEHISIFEASLVAAYIAFLTICGMLRVDTCNRMAGDNIVMSLISCSFALLWAGYSSFSSTSQFAAFEPVCEAKEFSISFFHLLFTLASAYLAMLCTNWGLVEGGAPWTMNHGLPAMWVNFTASWVVIALYSWICLAPVICRSRTFD